jgi:hypothetical protein
MYFDSSLNLEGVGIGVHFISPQGNHLKYVLQIHYKVSNNGTAYEALKHGLRIAVSLGIKQLIATMTTRSSSTKSTRHAISRRK